MRAGLNVSIKDSEMKMVSLLQSTFYILALKFLFVIIFEHFVFGVCKLIDIMVPDMPESLDIKIKRERYLAKEALQDAEHSKERQRRNTEGPDTEPEVDLEIGAQPNGKPKIDQP